MSDQNLDSFFNDEEAPVVQVLGTVITLRTTTGDSRYVPTTEPLKLSDLIAKSGLVINGAVTYWMGTTQLTDTNTVIPVGETVTLVGAVKGG